MATTTNFNWSTPDDTSLVKDGAAAIRTLGSSIDTTMADLKGGTTGQVLKKNTNTDMDFVWSADTAGMTNPLTTTGDTIYSSSGTTPARLGIGSTGQVLTVAGGLPTWAAAPSAGTSWTLLNTGGTALTGATTITVSGISSKDKIMVIIPLASSVNNEVPFTITLNSDTGANYYYFGAQQRALSTYGAANFTGLRANAENNFQIGTSQNTNAYAYIAGTMFINGAASSGVKSVQYTGGGANIGYNSSHAYEYGGYYNSSSTISSVSINSTNGNFDDGTIFVYTSN